MINQIFLSGYTPIQFKPLFFGSEKCSPGHDNSGYRDHYILHLIHKGEGTFYLRGKRWKLGPGDGFLIFPGEKNKYVASSNNPWQYEWVAWEDPSGELPEKFSLSPKNPCIHLPDYFSSDILNILQSDNSNLIKQNRSLGWFSSLMLYLMEEYPGRHIANRVKYNGKGTSIYGVKMQEFIHENFSSRINAADVVRHVNLERSYASRIFKKTFDTGIYEYISDIRFQKACELLMNDYTVKEICFTCGYSDYGNFLKTFRKISGLSPTEYRQKNKS
jgi:AraC family transcriptional regulator, arabinose operon regulatory protein